MSIKSLNQIGVKTRLLVSSNVTGMTGSAAVPDLYRNPGNVAFWPEVTVRGSTSDRLCPAWERQVTARTRTFPQKEP